MPINKLTAGDENTPGISFGDDIAESVNALIDSVEAIEAALDLQSVSGRTKAEIYQSATLDLNFAENRHNVYGAFGQELTALTTAITTARNSTATYQSPTAIVTAAINTPRITYDAATGNALGLLVEEQRTNLALQSKDFTTTWIQNPNASVDVTSNATTAPDGTLTADKMIEADTANTFHDLYQSYTATAATAYTYSKFVKAAERSKGSIVISGGVAFTTERTCTFDLVAKTAAITGTGATGGIIECPNGWFLVWVSAVSDAAGTATYFTRLRDAANAIIYPGVIGSGLFISDGQFEAGNYPSSRIPTTTAQVTRLAAFTTIPNLAELASTLPEYTIVVQGKWLDDAVAFGFGNTFDNCIYFAGKQFNIRSGGVSGPILSVPHTTDTFVKYAVRVKSGAFAAAVNGVITGISNTVINPPTGMIRTTIGSAPWEGSATQTNSANGVFSRITFIPRGLTNAELQSITS